MEYGHGGDIYGEYKIDSDFSVNTNPFGMPEGIKEAVLNQSDTWSCYPDSSCRELRKELSSYYNQDFRGRSRFFLEDFICGNGAADLLYSLIFALRPRRALLFQPCFIEYESALKAGGCEVDTLSGEEKDNFSFDSILSQLLDGASILDKIDMIILGNPNNPTGEVVLADRLLKLAEVCQRQHITLVVDECFNWFLKESVHYSVASFLEDYPNLFILNAFTKIFGMAGLRLGYGICKNREVMGKIESCRQPWSVSAVAVSAGIQALREGEFVGRTVDFIEEERGFLEKGLKSLGFTVYPSAVNYLLFKSDKKDLSISLKKRGILIRSCGNFPGLGENYYRVAVRLRSENEKLLDSLRSVTGFADVCIRKGD